MDWQPGQEDGEGANPDRDPGLPSPGSGRPGSGSGPAGPGSGPTAPGPGSGSGSGGRDPRLAAFAAFAAYGDPDAMPAGPVPCGLLALVLDEVSGPQRRSPGATGNERVGVVRAAAAIESWAAAVKLGGIREMIRHDGSPSPGSDHGDLPETWTPSLRHELAAALACSAQSADSTIWLAWELQARLPGTAERLEDGTLTLAKARAIAETFGQLMDADARAAEAMITDQLAGKTYTQVLRLAEQAALTVDPGLAERRREHAQKRNARVSFFREQAGTAALSGRDLPPDEALAAMAAVNARAEQYQESGAFGDTPTDVLRARAYLDLINAVPAEERIAAAEPHDDTADAAEAMAWHQARTAARTAAEPKTGNETGHGSGPEADGNSNSNSNSNSNGEDRVGPASGDPDAKRPGAGQDGAGRQGAVPPDAPDPARTGSSPQADPDQCPCADCDDDCCPCTECDGSCLVGGDLDLDEGEQGDGHPPDDDPDDGNHSDDDGGGGGPCTDGPGPRPGDPPAGRAGQRRPADLIVPLTTLLGLAERPGDTHGFGLLDPRLARELAAAAAASPRTEICVTVTSPQGYAIGHGCARPTPAARQARQAASPAALPARLNLTIPATTLPSLSGIADHTGPWSFTPRGRPGPPGAAPGRPRTTDYFGAWTLAIPGGRAFTVRLEPVPTFSCDHRYESHGYQPSDRLRHLVQIRDGTCTFPPCNRHARESDFEHAQPYDQGGRTCTCNAGARSRACHRVKQSPGWNLTQPRPGWHRWETPSGRVYVQEPKRYPA